MKNLLLTISLQLTEEQDTCITSNKNIHFEMILDVGIGEKRKEIDDMRYIFGPLYDYDTDSETESESNSDEFD